VSPAAKRKKKEGGPRVVKESGAGTGEISIWIDDVSNELCITWFCGGTYKWTAEAARAQYGRLLMFPGNFEGVWMSDRAVNGPAGYGDNRRYSCRVKDGKFYANERAAENGNEGIGARSVSWAQFNKALAAAIQELPAPTTTTEG
jgi:hypothetical protein